MNIFVQDILPSSPRYGGSVKEYVKTASPIFLVPFILIIAAFGMIAHITVFVLTAMILLYLLQVSRNKRTQFFYTWTLSSTVYLFLIFECKVVPLLTITMMENFTILILFIGLIYTLMKTKSIAYLELEACNENNKDQSPIISSDVLYCQVCKIEVRNRYCHSAWLDCCITKSNYYYYIIGLVLCDITVLYGANLTITTSCRPYIFWKTILMPEDCSHVYYEYNIAFCFVSAVYALCYATIITLTLLKNLLLSIKPIKYFFNDTRPKGLHHLRETISA